MTDEIEMKQGLVYQSDRTNQLRYSDKDGKEQWIQQNSRYKALETIKRGQAVSIAKKEDFERFGATEELNSTDTYIVLTDTRIHNRCIGLAEEPANKGDEIHVQSFGKFEYNKDYELLHFGLEYNPEFTFDDVGKTVYIAYPGPKFEGDSDLGPGVLTVNSDKVHKYYHNIIQIGHLTDAPVKDSNQKLTTIEVSIQGDDRGLLEATMFEGVMAEDVEINPLNPIRVFAFGEEEATKFRFTFKYTPLRDKNWKPSNQDFIFVHKMGGDGAFISFTDDFDPHKLIHDKDNDSVFAEYNFTTSNWAERKIYKANLATTDFADPAKLDSDIQILGNTFKQAWEELSGKTATVKCNNTTLVQTKIAEGDVSYCIDERIATIESNDYTEYFDVYISQSIKERLTDSAVVKHGSEDTTGKVILADIRYPNRRNVFGIYNGNETKLLKGHSYVFIRQGEIVIPKSNKYNFELGHDYYLDKFGTLNDRPLVKYGAIAKIATMKQDRRLVIDIRGIERMYHGSFPVGYQKPCAAELDENGNLNYVGEWGYAVCDGNAIYKKADYPIFYKRLIGWYPTNEIDCDDGVSFRVPRIVRETPFEYTGPDGQIIQKMVEVPVEMKMEADSIFEELNHTVFIRDFKRFQPEIIGQDVAASIEPFDISEIADYGFKDEPTIGIDNFDIHLYVDPRKDYNGGAHDWREIPEGFFKFNEANTFGFNFKLEYIQPDPIQAPYGKWILTTDIGDGHGIAYVEGNNSAPLKVTDCYYKLYVSRKEKIPRQFDIANVYKRYLTNTAYTDADEKVPFVTKAVTGKGVQLAIRNQHDIDSIIVNEGATIQFGNKEVKVKSFSIGSEGTIKIYADDDIVFETTLSEIGVNEIRKFIDDYWKEHHFTRTIDGHDWEKEYSNAEDDKGRIHGIITGQGGNVNASALEHIQVATLAKKPVVESENENDYEEHTEGSFKSSWLLKEEKGYIPLRSPDASGVMTESHEGQDKFFMDDGTEIETKTQKKSKGVVEEITRPNLTKDTKRVFKDKVDVGEKSLEIRYNFDIDTEPNDGVTTGEATDIDFIKTVDGKESYARLKIGSYTIASLSKLKRIYGENLPDTSFPTPLAQNSIKYDNDSNYFKSVLGSALQAAYEMPIAYWQYNNEQEWYNKTLSVVVERIQDTIANVGEVKRPIFNLSSNSDVVSNTFNYTDKESASIKEYLKSTLDTGNKGVNQTSQVGLLLEAAKETQERLLKLEASTFGADAETIPGNFKPKIETGVDGVTSDPTTLGLNRLVRAICLELYHDANPDNPAESDFYDDDNLRQPFSRDERDTSLSRIDALDRLLHGRVEGKEDGSKVALNYLKNINSSTYPYKIQDLPSLDRDNKVSLVPLEIVTKETVHGFKPLESNKYNFNGTIDALHRITEKVNALTTCIVGADNITAGPVELNKIRDRISRLETFDTKSLLKFDWEPNTSRMYSVVPLDEDND